MKFKLAFFLFLTSTISLFAQKIDYSTVSIADSLKENANAVVRLNQMDIVISSQRNMNVSTKRVVTVLNKIGLGAINAIENYNKTTTVKSIEATVFDAFGNEIKKIKRKDFRDQSAVDGGTLFSVSRVIYLDYTPIGYPFTIVFESETETSNTAFIPQWFPLDDYFVSIEKSVLNVNYPDNLGFKNKEFNFFDFQIKKTVDTPTQLSYTATNIVAQKNEDYGPNYYDALPKVMMGLTLFHLEGVDGTAKTWKEFGQWYSDKILYGTTELSEETKTKIKTLVGNEKDPVKKAKIIYNFVQQKSRYVSIQVGIGGWKPMLANDVDRLGYGDCKALTNYTKALLNAVDVPSFNTVLYGSKDKRDIESEFVSMQGNHMILSIPNGDDYIWLECTSQDDPFGYQGIFTDDRNVLIMKPEGGEIVRTKIYPDKENTQTGKGNYSLTDNGDFSGKITIVSEGSQYSPKALVEKFQPNEKDAYYKDYWDNINNLKINKATFSNDKERVILTENVEMSAANYGNISGNKMLFALNAFSQFTGGVKRIRNRKSPFEIQRGFYDHDEIAITLPKGFTIESIPQDFELSSKFGDYKTEIIKMDNGNLVYKRSLFIKKGLYQKNEYDEFRLFMEKIAKNDNSKTVLIKN
ncbi:DUF3857 domain-containing protein [Flavobacterium sp.]|uniref:DUF3857 domain-containing protein n=1 Tax=Flavobacterium sp. TaxID=239 RepID=UPI002B4B300C|nr:DUF3857 domain-containing protein [Flavobacterium sp.]HLF52952.1 DUF3857 domain-containing protein [Flavobacterium sp.]